MCKSIEVLYYKLQRRNTLTKQLNSYNQIQEYNNTKKKQNYSTFTTQDKYMNSLENIVINNS